MAPLAVLASLSGVSTRWAHSGAGTEITTICTLHSKDESQRHFPSTRSEALIEIVQGVRPTGLPEKLQRLESLSNPARCQP